MTPPDAIVVRLVVPDLARDDADALTCELLAALASGGDAAVLRPLFAATPLHARRAAAFIVSELGAAAAPVLADAVSLLAEDSKLIRYYVLDALHAAAVTQGATLDPRHVADALTLLDDDEPALAEKVMSLLVDVDAGVLAAVPLLVADKALRDDVVTLLGADADAVGKALAGDDGRRRLLAAVAAVRLAGQWDGAWPALAASESPEIVEFGDAQRQIAGRLRRREALVAG